MEFGRKPILLRSLDAGQVRRGKAEPVWPKARAEEAMASHVDDAHPELKKPARGCEACSTLQRRLETAR